MRKTTIAEKEKQIREKAKKDGITHISTGIVIVNNGKVLIVRRTGDDFLGGNYELPGGGIEPGEDFAYAVAREAFEETGLKVLNIIDLFNGFDYSTNKKPKVRQINFIVDVAESSVKLSDEHDDYKWVSPDEVDEYKMSDEIKKSIKAVFRKTQES
jgi:8-oxo-dGTP diphosphatase